MILHMWTVDANGVTIEDEYYGMMSDKAEASAVLLRCERVETASDEFLHEALTQWFTTGKITRLHEGNDQYWNVELVDN